LSNFFRRDLAFVKHNKTAKSLTGTISSGFKQMLLLKILAKQDIIDESEAESKSGDWTPRGMKDTNKPVQEYVASIPC